MSFAKWQRHSNFLSVRGRTWIGRAYGVGVSGKRGGGLAGLWQRVKRGASTGRPVAAPPRKEGGGPSSARDMATPGQLQGSARTANGAVRDGC